MFRLFGRTVRGPTTVPMSRVPQEPRANKGLWHHTDANMAFFAELRAFFT